MTKKIAALITLIAFGMSSTACMTWRTREVRTVADYPRQDKKVLAVYTASGGVIQFSRSDPGRIVGQTVVGRAYGESVREVEVQRPFRLIRKANDGSVASVTDSAGRVYIVRKVLKEEPDRMLLQIVERGIQPLSIPLAEARLIKVKRLNLPLTILAVVGVGSAAFVAALAHALNDDM